MLVYNKEGAGLGSETPSANQGILQEFLQQATQGAGAGHLPENVQGAGAAATVAGAAVGAPNPALFEAAEERALAWALSDAVDRCGPLLEEEDFAGVMGAVAALRRPVDAFFDTVTVNCEDPALRGILRTDRRRLPEAPPGEGCRGPGACKAFTDEATSPGGQAAGGTEI